MEGRRSSRTSQAISEASRSAACDGEVNHFRAAGVANALLLIAGIT